MKLTPIMTEKSMGQASSGKYTFWVGRDMTKDRIKKLINKSFGVHVVSVKTVAYKARTKTNIQRKKVGVKAAKKAIVTLKPKEKIDLFSTESKKK